MRTRGGDLNSESIGCTGPAKEAVRLGSVVSACVFVAALYSEGLIDEEPLEAALRRLVVRQPSTARGLAAAAAIFDEAGALLQV